MASEDITRGELEITVPWEEVRQESERVVGAFRKQVRVPGFRPGKVPESVIRMRFRDEVRSEVLDKLINKFFWREAEEQDYQVIGSPRISDVEFVDDQPLKFRAEFEIIPDFELSDYKRIRVPYRDPTVEPKEIDEHLERLRDEHASFRNLDPRPLATGDIAVVALKSEGGDGAPAIDQSETTLTIGGEETLEDFTKALEGKSPGDELDFEVSYPDDFGNEQLAGKKIQFHAKVQGIRVRERPDLDDDFAQDVGDFQTLDELKQRLEHDLREQKRRLEVDRAKDRIVDLLVDRHDFPAPERLIENQVRSRLERTVRSMAQQGVDPSQLDLDWKKIGEEQRPRALRDVKAGLLLERIAEVEAIEAEQEEIDAQVERYARQAQMTLGAARKKLAEDGALDRLRSQLTNEKVLNFLFDEAEKVEPPEEEKLEETGAASDEQSGETS